MSEDRGDTIFKIILGAAVTVLTASSAPWWLQYFANKHEPVEAAALPAAKSPDQHKDSPASAPVTNPSALPVAQAKEGTDAAETMYVRGEELENGTNGFRKDLRTAVEWYKKAATRGHATAQSRLGFLCEYGDAGFPRDERQSAYWYRKAADQGDVYAELHLGHYYLFGQGGLPKSTVDAFNWYKKAADQGDGDGAYKVGASYRAGTGVPKDEKEAAHWYQRSAALHNKYGTFQLARMYVCGEGGLPKDVQKAASLFESAGTLGLRIYNDAQTAVAVVGQQCSN